MLDEGLPTFYLRASKDDVKHHASVLLSHHGSDAVPAYSLHHPDPALPASHNRYASALYDSFNSEILFGEVLLIPDWTKPSLNKEEIRQNGGVPPPPQPVLPTEFVIQLYNPDQQVAVRLKGGSWNTAPYWEFELPQQTFRQPSASSLDRVQSDPTASENTPKLVFKWKKDGKLSKDYVCTLSGKSNNPDGSKKKNKEPDITISIFKHFKEVTIYEPNLSRVEVEDPKGLEIVLLLGAIVIREVYNTSVNEAFNIVDTPQGTRLQPANGRATSAQAIPSQPPHSEASNSRPPPTDPRSQWEIDAETTRLKKQVEREERQRQRAQDAETKRVKRLLEEEERKKKEMQKEIDRETERLKKMYGKGQHQSLQQYSSLQPHQTGQPVTAYPPAPVPRPQSASPYLAHNLRPPQPPRPYPQSQVLAAQGPNPSFGASGASKPPASVKKSSFWHIGKKDERQPESRLTKRRSVVF